MDCFASAVHAMTSPNMHDAIIIGAGHNGLTCAYYLAKRGLKVAVLERAPEAERGGATVTSMSGGAWFDVASGPKSIGILAALERVTRFHAHRAADPALAAGGRPGCQPGAFSDPGANRVDAGR